MITVNDVHEYLCSIAPVEAKMDFDNIGFLVGRSDADASTILVSLDITNDVITEALDIGAGLIVSHHPLFFSLKSVTDADITGGKVVRLLSGGIAAICMHTNLDAARGGTNDVLAAAAGITIGADGASLLSEDGQYPDGTPFSYGRAGYLENPLPLTEYLEILKEKLGADGLRYCDAGREVHHVAVVGGSGGSELHCAAALGCDTLVTADIKYDVFLDAKELGINLIDAGHFHTENPVVAVLADKLRTAFPEAKITASKTHATPMRFF